MKFAHISDLHVGKIPKNKHLALLKSLDKEKVDFILVTGDVTDLGKNNQWNKFIELYKPIWEKLIIIPGNHDCATDNVAKLIMKNRVEVLFKDKVKFIKINSTAPHNKFPWVCHGEITDTLDAVEYALNRHINLYTVIMLHHHPLPLPEDGLLDRLSSLIVPYTKELKLGNKLVEISKGKCDLILHGHRHTPSSFEFPGNRYLRIYNAGCTPGIKRYRVFNTGKNLPKWISY